MLLIITGNGKGKTTSAIGTAIRGLGWEKKIALVHFDKGGSHYGEQHIFDFLQAKNQIKDLDIFRFGAVRFNKKEQTFRLENTPKDKEEVQKGISKLLTLYKEGYFLIIADELISCLNSDLTDEAAVRDIIGQCPKDTHLMLTGRNAPDWLIEKADLVSEVKEVKHYFNPETSSVGQQAIKGLDY